LKLLLGLCSHFTNQALSKQTAYRSKIDSYIIQSELVLLVDQQLKLYIPFLSQEIKKSMLFTPNVKAYQLTIDPLVCATIYDFITRGIMLL